jgi:hypothetical protein
MRNTERIFSSLLIILFCGLCSAVLFSQEEGEAPEPEVELPELSLSFEEGFSEVLPLVELDIDEALDPAAPEALELEREFDIRPGDLELPMPAFDALPYGTDAAPLYGRGYIGFGSSNALRGEVEIATMGADPGFALAYLHSSLDGFGVNSPGEGFTFRREEIRGEAGYAGLGGDAGFSGSFIEEERGLQGESVFASVLRRSSSASLSYEYLPETGWYASGSATVEGSYQNLTGASPEDVTHLTFNPGGEAGYGWEKFSLGLEGSYSLRTASEDDPLHYGVLSLALQGDPGPRLGVRLRLGGAYSSEEEFRLPGNLRVSAGLSENLTAELEGGYFFRPAGYAPLLEEYPFIRIPASPLGNEEGWEADLLLRLRLGTGLYLSAGSGFTRGELYRAGDTSEGPTPLLPVVLDDVRELTPRGGIEFPLGDRFFGSFSTQLRYDYREASLESAELGLELESETLASRSGLRLEGSWDISDLSSAPVAGGEAWWEPLAGVRFILDVRDVLSGMNPGGRVDESGLEIPGLVVSFATEISL